MQQGAPHTVRVHVPEGAWVHVWVRFEDGGGRDLTQLTNDEPPRSIDGRLVGEATFEIPGDLPPATTGWAPAPPTGRPRPP